MGRISVALTDIKQLIKFINVRNSSSFGSNLQFSIDAEDCGFEIEELGQPVSFGQADGLKGYYWKTKFGILEEIQGKIFLHEIEKYPIKKILSTDNKLDYLECGHTLPTPSPYLNIKHTGERKCFKCFDEMEGEKSNAYKQN
jgi:hypothetical protein